MPFQSTKIIELGSTAFRQWRAKSHCAKIHGYHLIAKIWFNADTLDENGWIVDFGSLKHYKKDLEYFFDHKTAVAIDDPEISTFEFLHQKGIIQMQLFGEGVGIEKFAKFISDRVDRQLKKDTNNRCWVSKVEVWEHNKNSAIYENHDASTPQAINIPCDDYTEAQKIAETIRNVPKEKISNDLIEIPDNPNIKVEVQDIKLVPPMPLPARVGNITSSGHSDLFKGTSWGNKK